MNLPSGIPTISALAELKKTELYRQHVQFNADFLAQHSAAMQEYGRHWGLDPFRLWSRRWEYPFVGQRLMSIAADAVTPVQILDAGSGVTYFPYYVIRHAPCARFICCDYDESYAPMFDAINRDRDNPPVRFLKASLQKLPLEDSSLDAVCCISVLEHTDNYGDIVNEFARVLRPGGLFVLTFDLSLDGKFTLPKAQAGELLDMVAARFELPRGFDARRELDRMSDPDILTTDYVRRTEPDLLPWSFPVRVYKAAQDLVQGKGWTSGFRSRTILCVEGTRKQTR